jgi:hypothetical protein
MTKNSTNDSRSEKIEQIEDLASVTDVQNPEQVKGGFNPQPDPPGVVYQPPQLPIIGVLRR